MQNRKLIVNGLTLKSVKQFMRRDKETLRNRDSSKCLKTL